MPGTVAAAQPVGIEPKVQAQALKLQVVDVALEVQEPLVTHDVLEPLANTLDLGGVAAEDIGQILVEAVRQYVLEASRVDALRVRPALAELTRLRAIRAEGAALEVLPEPGAKQHLLRVCVETDGGKVVEDHEGRIRVLFDGGERERGQRVVAIRQLAEDCLREGPRGAEPPLVCHRDRLLEALPLHLSQVVVELDFVGGGKQVVAAMRAEMHDRGVEILHGRETGLVAELVGGERDDLAEQIAGVAVLERGSQTSRLLTPVAEHQHLAPVVRQARIHFLRRLLGELCLNERRKRLLPARPEVVDAALRRSCRLAHGAAVERGLALTVTIEPDRQLTNLVVREAVADVKVPGTKVEPHELRPVGVAWRVRKQLESEERALGLAPQKRESVE